MGARRVPVCAPAIDDGHRRRDVRQTTAQVRGHDLVEALGQHLTVAALPAESPEHAVGRAAELFAQQGSLRPQGLVAEEQQGLIGDLGQGFDISDRRARTDQGGEEGGGVHHHDPAELAAASVPPGVGGGPERHQPAHRMTDDRRASQALRGDVAPQLRRHRRHQRPVHVRPGRDVAEAPDRHEVHPVTIIEPVRRPRPDVTGRGQAGDQDHVGPLAPDRDDQPVGSERPARLRLGDSREEEQGE